MVTTSPPAAYAAGRGRRWILVAGLIVVFVAVLDIVVVLAWPGHHTSRPLRFAPPPNASALNADARNLVALLQRGSGLTVHATYRATPDPVTLELWEQAPRVREDIAQSAGGHTAQTTTMTDGPIDRICYRRDSGPLTCQVVTAVQRQAVGLDGIIAAIVGGLAGQPVAVTSSTVAGVKAECFTVGTETRICLAADGLPVLISSRKVTYQLASRSTTVDPAVFTPPKP